jgi:thiosulfate/3-mercaptopyruvate sulfurtransferase
MLEINNFCGILQKNFFAAAMDSYGIRNQDHIIITARESVYFTPRVWFLFKTFGHDPSKLHLMQGSLERWIELGGDVETEAVTVPVFQDLKLKEDYSYRYHVESATNVCGIENVLGAITTNEEEDDEEVLILDSRGSSFAKGHMPGAIHLPYSQWVLPESTLEWKPVDELKAIFADNDVDPMTDKNIICSCGSGVSVCHTLLALELCGRDLRQEEKTKMYDASWSEYGKIDDTPKIRSKRV